MASSIGALTQDQFLCPICLDVFNQPVSTPCGHNFCLPCITSCWSQQQACQCPVCKHLYPQKPDLKVNTFISELASHFTSLQLTDAVAGGADQQRTGDGSSVSCDICTDTKQEAVRSCVECQTSYCGVHLEPHHRAAGLKRHTLIEPVANLEERICREHNSLLMSFCKSDNAVLCSVCASSKHAQHNVVSVQQAHAAMRHRLASAEDKVQEEIQKRITKVQRVKESLRQSQAEVESVMADSERELTALLFEIREKHAQLIRLTEEEQKASEEQAEGFIRDVEREIATLQKTAANMRELSQTEDSLSFLQMYSKVVLPLQTMDPSTFEPKGPPEIKHIRKAVSKLVSQMRLLLDQMCVRVEEFSTGACASTDDILKLAQQCEVNVTLDPDTAHPQLILSDDLKQVRFSSDFDQWRRQAQNTNPDKFSEHLAVLGQRGFSCNFYFEVFVGEKTEFCLGVAMASIPRKRALRRTLPSGLWAIWLFKDKFESFSNPDVTVYQGKAKRIGVYADYEERRVSFFAVEAKELIYSFSHCHFTRKLYPYFNPCDNEYGSNWDPMIIVPVRQADQTRGARYPASDRKKTAVPMKR